MREIQGFLGDSLNFQRHDVYRQGPGEFEDCLCCTVVIDEKVNFDPLEIFNKCENTLFSCKLPKNELSRWNPSWAIVFPPTSNIAATSQPLSNRIMCMQPSYTTAIVCACALLSINWKFQISTTLTAARSFQLISTECLDPLTIEYWRLTIIVHTFVRAANSNGRCETLKERTKNWSECIPNVRALWNCSGIMYYGRVWTK